MRNIGKHAFPWDNDWWDDTPSALANSPDNPSASRNSNPPGSSGTGGSGGSGTLSSPPHATSASPFVINVVWDASVQSAPAGFTTAVVAAVQYLESQFTDPITIGIDIGYGEVAGMSLGSNALGESETYLASMSYSTLLGALRADAKTATDAAAVASLPATSPVNGTLWTSTAEAKALGLIPSNATLVDGYVGFSSLPGIFDYNASDGVTAGTYDFNAVALHEVTEVMGRMLLTGTSIAGVPRSYDALDLFHYSASGRRDFSASTPGYFSVNGGSTGLGQFNTIPGGDAGDWASSMGNDALDAFANSGVVNGISSADLAAMDAIGWDYAGPKPSTPTGVALAPATSSLATLQGSSALNANVALASVAQFGGATGDSYSYSLGGANAASFKLATAGNVATLSPGAAGVAGAANGRLYALTVTATDTTYGTSSPAAPLDVIVGGGSGDTIQAAGLVGAASAATPTFIYGLAGADKINASGMTGNVWLAGGAGADTMTGGNGVNDYLYGAVGDSTIKATDIITNFHAAKDLIDLTGLGTPLTYAGKLPGPIAPHSVGWQVNGNNTFVYANTGSSSASLGSTGLLVIELTGQIALSGNNIVHL